MDENELRDWTEREIRAEGANEGLFKLIVWVFLGVVVVVVLVVTGVVP